MSDTNRSRPVLVLLNGPPASGKSTLAQRWVQVEERLAVVDIDTIRSGLDLWPEDPVAAGLMARRTALRQIASHLDTACSVVVPQFLRRDGFIEELAATAVGGRAAFVECVLRITRQVAINAFIERSEAPSRREHVDADVLVSAENRAVDLGAMYDALGELCRTRPGTRFVDVSRGDVEVTLGRLRAVVPEI